MRLGRPDEGMMLPDEWETFDASKRTFLAGNFADFDSSFFVFSSGAQGGFFVLLQASSDPPSG